MLKNVICKNNCYSLMKTSTRTRTWVLRRRIMPELPLPMESEYVVGPVLKVRPEYERELRQFDYLYTPKAVQKKRPDIEVILLEMVEGKGMAGDIVKVRPGYMRHQLALQQKAVYASPKNLELYKDLIAKVQQKIGYSSAISRNTSEMLEKALVPVVMSPDQEWTIQPWHVRVSMRKTGIFVADDSCIELPKAEIKGPDINGKQNKDFAVFVTINQSEKVAVRCCLHHYGLPLESDWDRPIEPRGVILEEQGDLLASMYRIIPPPEETEDN